MTIRDELREMILEAKNTNQVIHCQYQDLWWTPTEFANDLDDGRFHWGRKNFTIRDPSEHTKQLENARDSAIQQLERWTSKLNQ